MLNRHLARVHQFDKTDNNVIRFISHKDMMANTYKNRINLLAIGMLTCVLLAGLSPARAQNDPVRSYNAKSTINDYNRPGAFNGWFTAGYNAEFAATCTQSGDWDKQARGICYQAGSDSCSCSTACDSDSDTVTWNTRHASISDLSISRINECNSSICLSEIYDAPGSNANPEIRDNTGDPMLALMDGGDGYIEMESGVHGNDGGGIHWFYHYGSPAKYLMIPTKAQDYRAMRAAANTSVFEVENACMPASFSIDCPSPPSASCSCNSNCGGTTSGGGRGGAGFGGGSHGVEGANEAGGTGHGPGAGAADGGDGGGW